MNFQRYLLFKNPASVAADGFSIHENPAFARVSAAWPAARMPFPFRPRSARVKIFFFDREKRQGEYNVPLRWGSSSVGRAPRSQRGGRGFNPLLLHHLFFSFRSSVFLIGRETVALSRFLPERNRLPRPRTACVSRTDAGIGFRSLGGGLRSWLAVRYTCTPALYLTAPLLLRLLLPVPGPLGYAGGSTERRVERERRIPAKWGSFRRVEPAASGRKVARVAPGKPPASLGPRLPEDRLFRRRWYNPSGAGAV